MNKHTQPLVSVIMPVYNAGGFLVESIESILNQTYRPIELIVVDDASTDNSWAIINRFKKRYPKRITALRLTKQMNKGGDACANEAFKLAKGMFIARMDADDISHPDRLTKQVAFLQDHPEVLLVGSQARVINQKGTVIGHKRVPQNHKQIYEGYFAYNPIIHPTMMVRRSLLPKHKKLYTIRYSANNDLNTFFELLKLGRFANIPEELLDYRMHGKNDSLTYPKERFLNTLKIRLRAIGLGYVPTVKGIVMTAIQTVAILILPEKIIVPVYLYMKGIKKISRKSKLRLPLFLLPRAKKLTT